MFYVLAMLTVVSALLSVTSTQIFRSAIYLLFSLVGVAGLYFWLDYQFVAAVQVVVYVGGIAVLIIFSIFLTQQSGEKLPAVALNRKLVAGLASGAGLALVLALAMRYVFPPATTTASPTVAEIGEKLLDINGYALPFEVISVLLLAAMIGCIVIALTQRNTQTK